MSAPSQASQHMPQLSTHSSHLAAEGMGAEGGEIAAACSIRAYLRSACVEVEQPGPDEVLVFRGLRVRMVRSHACMHTCTLSRLHG